MSMWQFFLKTGFLRNIVIVSVCIAVVFPLASWFLVYEQFKSFEIETVEKDAIRVANYLKSGLQPGPEGITRSSIPLAYAAEADEIGEAFGLAKYKVFSARGETVFSTDKQDIGVINENTYFHNIVAKGQIYTKLAHKNNPTLDNSAFKQDIMETYVPVMDGDRFAGAFEIYYDVTDRQDRLNNLLFVSSLVLGLVAIGLLGAVAWTVRRALKAMIARDEAEASLKISEGQFRDFAEAASDWFWELDANLCWSYFSDRFAVVSGIPPERLLGKSFEATEFGKENPEAYRAQLDILARHKPFRNYQMESQFPDGRIVYLSISANPVFSPDGEFEGYRGSGTDVTSAKQAMIIKNQFISTVSHELRTPLTSINGALGLLPKGPFGTFTQEGKELIDVARRNCNQLINLVSDLLDIERLEEPVLEFNLRSLNLSSLTQEVVENNLGLAQEYGIQIRIDELHAGLMVNGDADRLRQVLGNLISNAAKFSKKGATVHIATFLTGDAACVSVTDFGKGISETFRDRIFERFAQEDSSDTREKGGTGLGLNISKSIIEKHGGELWFESRPGVRTTFSFKLPRLSS